MRQVAALAAGLLFGLGLTISGMINPAKVVGFLDIAGNWDPSLALVMGAAVPVAALGFALGKRRGSPFFAGGFAMPARTDVSLRLVGGAGIFGIGWGLVGYCPGPALASLTVGGWKSVVFVVAMLVGMAAFTVFDSRSIIRDPQTYPPRP